jgi:hypothetical protein
MANGTAVIWMGGAAKELPRVNAEARTSSILDFIWGVLMLGVGGQNQYRVDCERLVRKNLQWL